MNITIHTPRPLTSTHRGRAIAYDARYIADGRQKPILLFSHGFKGFKDWGYFNLLADEFARSGYVFVKFNHSHNGTTPDHPTEFVDLEAFGHNNFSIEMDDMGTVINHIFSGDFPVPSEELNLQQFFLIGHSRGGGLVLMKAHEEKRAKGVVALAAVTQWEDRWPESLLQSWKEKGVQMITNSRTGQEMPLYYQMVEDYYQHQERFDLPNIIKNLKTPVLAFHGTADETVAIDSVHQLAEWKPDAQIETIEDADHTFGGQHPYSKDNLPQDVEFIKQRSITFMEQLN